MFTPEQQEFTCLMAPEAFAPVANAWGKRGATTALLAKTTHAELEDALRRAWRRAAINKPQEHRIHDASDRRRRVHSSAAKKRRTPGLQYSSLFRLATGTTTVRPDPDRVAPSGCAA